jgi:ribosomal-protein-alanine N-acetyltransferase
VELLLKKFTIRSWRGEDAAALALQANNRKVWRGLRDLFPHPYSIEDAERYLEQAMKEQPPTSFCIEVAGAAAGVIGLRFGCDVHRYTAELGYWLGEEFWGHGIATEAVRAFSAWAFQTFNLHRIQAETFSNNPASARVLEKAGFTCEGRQRKNVVKDGVVLDSLLYACVR